MEYRQCWNIVYDLLMRNGIDETSDVDWILCEVLKINRAELKLINNITDSQFDKIMEIANLRAKHIPLQRIFGVANFYGLEFNLNEDTLVPRFDTEVLVEKVLKYVGNKNLKVLDLCTGSGCIAVSIAKFSNCKVVATDINENALSMAKQNAIKNNVNIDFIKSNMFESIPLQKFDVIVSNPPYIKTGDIPLLEPTVKDYDPLRALDGGIDGLEFYRIIQCKSKEYLEDNGKIFLEIEKKLSKSLANLFGMCYNNFEIVKDLQGNDRVLVAYE